MSRPTQKTQKTPDRKNMKKKTIILEIFLDTEYISNSQYISIQYKTNVTIPHLNIKKTFKQIIFDNNYRDFIEKSNLQFKTDNPDVLITYKNIKNNLLDNVLFQSIMENVELIEPNLFSEPIQVFTNLFFYFSITDLYVAFGQEAILNLVKQKSIRQRRTNISGSFIVQDVYKNQNIKYHVKLKDMSGLNRTSLKNFANSYGLNVEDKGLLDSYKTEMEKGLFEMPNQFCLYAYNDCELLEKILLTVINSLNELLKKVFLEQTFEYSNSTVPMTIGTIVDNLYNFYFENTYMQNNDFAYMALAKKSILDPLNKNYNLNLSLLKDLNGIKNKQQLKAFKIENPALYDRIAKFARNRNNFSIYATQYCSHKFLTMFQNSSDYNIASLASIVGGRTVNERPFEMMINYGVDIDIVSAYSSTLQNFGLIVGEPNITETDFNSEKIKLKQFLKKFKNKKLSKYTKILVSGNLSFEQNLILSRIDSDTVLAGALKKSIIDEEISQTTRTPALLRKQIYNGTLTMEFIDILKKTCSSLELKEFYELDVIAALYYLESDLLSWDDFLNECFENPKTKKWCVLPFKPFMEKLIDLRNVYKKSSDPNIFAQNITIKLIMNTFYGLLSSIYFKINNALLGDLITGHIRVCSWLLTTALGGSQTITDGTAFDLTTVLKFKKEFRPSIDKKPSLSALSNFYALKNHRSIIVNSLENKNWEEYFSKLPHNYDLETLKNSCFNHVKLFWSHYNIELSFDLEIKNIFKNGAYFGKSFYYYLEYDSKANIFKPYYKIRGFRLNNKDLHKYPAYEFLKYLCENQNDPNILDKPFKILNNGEYTSRKLLKIPMYLHKIKQNSNYELIPGDEEIKISKYKISNDYMFVNDLKDLKKRIRRKVPQKNAYKQLFEKFLEYSIKTMLKKMIDDSLK